MTVHLLSARAPNFKLARCFLPADLPIIDGLEVVVRRRGLVAAVAAAAAAVLKHAEVADLPHAELPEAVAHVEVLAPYLPGEPLLALVLLRDEQVHRPPGEHLEGAV